jgi:thymidylate synthase (FAD)
VKRTSVPKLDAILGKPWPVLRHGFVRLVDYMGDDRAIVQAARISYGAGTKSIRKDSALIRYLLRQDHTSPFEMCEIKLHIRAPMDVDSVFNGNRCDGDNKSKFLAESVRYK